MGNTTNPLLIKRGGYRKLHTFKLARLIYDITLRFCDTYISKRSRTHDQMVQAARSGVQNIAEGSIASATSKRTELKLTNVARASLEELRLDFEDYLRQNALEVYEPTHPALLRFKTKRCGTLLEFRRWIRDELQQITAQATRASTISQQDKSNNKKTAELASNAALALLNLCCYFLDRQLQTLANKFVAEGGFTERMNKVRSEARKNNRQ